MSVTLYPPYFECQNISSAQISSVNNSNCILWRVENFALPFHFYLMEFEVAHCIFEVFETISLFNAVFNYHWVDTLDDSSKDVDVPFTTTRLRFSKCLSSLSESFMVIASKQTRDIQQQIKKSGSKVKNMITEIYIFTQTCSDIVSRKLNLY